MNTTDFRLALVRACTTEWDCQDRLTGNLDVPLNDEGRELAVGIAREMEFYPFSAIITAPCLAARQTAEILAEELGLRLRVDPLLVNLDLGLWQGKQIDELRQCQPSRLRNWQEAADQCAPPEGETTDPARARIQRSLKRWSRKYRECQLIMVAPEPLASVIKSEFGHSEVGDLTALAERCGRWEWLQARSRVTA